MRTTKYKAPALETTAIEVPPLMVPSVTATGGNAGITKADPSEDVPTVAQSRRKDIWTDPEEEEEEDF